MNINDLKKLVKYCIYEEKGIVCMNDTYYNDMIHTMENLQSKIDKANEILDKLEMQPAYLDCKYYELEGFKELKEVLKEDK